MYIIFFFFFFYTLCFDCLFNRSIYRLNKQRRIPLLSSSVSMRAETHQHRRQPQDQSTRVLYDLCSMIIHILRSPPPLPLSIPGPSSRSPRQASPAAFASLFFGISVAMMLFGSVTFVIGFFLMPMVIGLLMLFYFIGLIYNLSELGRAILWPGSGAVPPGWTYL